MIDIIKKHRECYPLMEVQDVAKLLYQSEFGGGHLIADPERSLKRIQEEFQVMDKDAISHLPEVEWIGDGMCRIYLSCLAKGMRAEVLNDIFVASANRKKGTAEGLEQKIALYCKENQSEEVSMFFEKWKAEGYPMMSHSNSYREAYKPAYRVVEASAAKIYEIIRTVEEAKRPFVVAIEGMSASGKSTLGELLHKNYPSSNLFHMDDYFLQPHQRTEERLAEAGGNVDYERIKEEIIAKLEDKEGFTYYPFDCQTQSIQEGVQVPWSDLTFVEGCYSQHPYFGTYYDFGIFCEIAAEEQVERIRKRNGEFMLKRFQEEWIPRENQYFKTYAIKEKSGLQ